MATPTIVGRMIQTPTVSEMATIANYRDWSFGGLPQLPIDVHRAFSGSRVDSRIRRLAIAVPRSTIQETASPIRIPDTPTITAAIQLWNAKPVVTR